MPELLKFVYIIIAYLLGSIPTAVWLGKTFFHIDIREHGSGNAGATNTFRVLGPKIGVPVLLFDVFKGFAAVQLALLVKSLEIGSNPYISYQLVLGTAALLGHIFPVYAQFKGGKGVATLLGFMLGVHPYASLVCVGVFLLVFVTTRIVSVSSMSAALSFPFVVVFIFKSDSPALMLFSAFIAIAVVVTHRANIKRLLHKEEAKVSLKRKSKKDPHSE